MRTKISKLTGAIQVWEVESTCPVWDAKEERDALTPEAKESLILALDQLAQTSAEVAKGLRTGKPSKYAWEDIPLY